MASRMRLSLLSSSVLSLFDSSGLGWSGKCAALHMRSAASASAVGGGKESSSGSVPLATQGPYITHVKSRGVIKLDGPEVFKFLQGLVTNDVTRLEQDRTGASVAAVKTLYTALLSPQGRFLYDLFLYHQTSHIKQPDQGKSNPGQAKNSVPCLVADVDLTIIDELVTHLSRHRLRAKVSIENISSDLKVWQRFGGAFVNDSSVSSEANEEIIDKSTGTTDDRMRQGWRWYNDPRLTDLGLRGVFPSNSSPPFMNADQEVGEEKFLQWRLEQGVPEGSPEIAKGEAVPLEYNLAALNAISFEKGCYVGQELIARTHHRGVIRKRVLPVNFLHEEGKEVLKEVVPGLDIVDVISKKKVGKVTTVLGHRGLALVRLEAALKESAQLKLNIPEKTIYLKVTRPKWWPGEWGQEDLQQTVASA